MKLHRTFLYWLMLLVPTLVIGVMAVNMIRKENRRLGEDLRQVQKAGIRVIADGIKADVLALQNELAATLAGMPEKDLIDRLLTMERDNPLVRNVFVWDPGSGKLVYPLTDLSATQDERLFVRRYAGLFSGQTPWEAPAPESREKPGVSFSARIHSEKIAVKSMLGIDAAQVPGLGKGWIPWFEENRLHLLGWVRRSGDGVVYGVEIEMMALISRLVPDLSRLETRGVTYTLVDGMGQVVCQSGPTAIDTGVVPEITVPLAPMLPHWRVAGYVDADSLVETGKGTLILSLLVVLVFLISVVSSGVLMAREAQRNMKDAMQKTSFVSNVSHELKTPLTSIRMYAELLKEGRVSSEEKRQRYLDVMVAESRRLTRLVNNVLDFGRLEQGRKKYRIEELDIVRFAGDTVDMDSLRISAAGMTLKTVFPDEPVVVRADRDAVEQVLLNLVDNAVKYACSGGELLVRVEKNSGECVVSVMDRGPGIPHGHRERIFEKFHRVDDSLTAEKGGSGLGLSIACRLVSDMNGCIAWREREGGGSVFEVRLPLREQKQEGGDS